MTEAPSEHALAYFTESVRNYQKAVRLDPKSALAFLGLGFQCEEGLHYPESVKAAWQALNLRGIAVWFDRNANGVSDRGEVVSLAKAGIRRVAVTAQGRRDGALWNAAGIERTDGTTAATFDWTPASLPLSSHGADRILPSES